MRSRKDNSEAEEVRVRFCIVAIGLGNWTTLMVRRVKGGKKGSNDINPSYKDSNMVADGEIILHFQEVESSKNR